MPSSDLHEPVLTWYADHARNLPWRAPGVSAWAVLVSEFMLQQTPVARVLPVYDEWLQRWPQPADLARAAPGEAVRCWGRLGYPRRALRLHSAARVVVDEHAGEVPSAYDDLLALPGIGGYTAAAVASFAFRQRHAVLDTNVRRVLARAVAGVASASTTITKAEQTLAQRLVPDGGEQAAQWAVALMELGALVCTPRAPRCRECPLAAACAWRRAGQPAHEAPRRRAQRYTGTDRYVRGLILARLRSTTREVAETDLDALWPDHVQLRRAEAGLVADGLVTRSGSGYALPS